jgi:hypothetical protein
MRLIKTVMKIQQRKVLLIPCLQIFNLFYVLVELNMYFFLAVSGQKRIYSQYQDIWLRKMSMRDVCRKQLSAVLPEIQAHLMQSKALRRMHGDELQNVVSKSIMKIVEEQVFLLL